MTIEIAVYGSNSLVLVGLISTLSERPDLRVINIDDANSISTIESRADLLILERSLDEDLWLERTRLPTDFDLPVILLTDFLTTEEIDGYLELGFRGFLPRLVSAVEVLATVDATLAGLIVIHPDLAFKENNLAIAPATTSELLTSRELEVLKLLADGLDNKAIALQLQISKHTVKFHISSILSKLDVSSRTEAVTFGLRQGLILL